jgi:hypothetical protein
MIPRLIKMFTSPEDYWNEMVAEPGDIKSLLMPQMAVLAAVPAVAGFLGSVFIYFRFGFSAVVGALIAMILQYFLGLATWIGLGYIIDFLAEPFNAQRDIGQSMKLATGAVLPGWILSAILILPVSFLRWLVMMAGAGYGFYLLFKGLPIMNATPPDRALVYTIAAILILLVISAIVTTVVMCPVSCMMRSALTGGMM